MELSFGQVFKEVVLRKVRFGSVVTLPSPPFIYAFQFKYEIWLCLKTIVTTHVNTQTNMANLACYPNNHGGRLSTT